MTVIDFLDSSDLPDPASLSPLATQLLASTASQLSE